MIRRPAISAFAVIILIASVSLVVLSPLALAEIAHFRNDWTQLSNIGQTYGAISAVLSALALGGVIASLLYQARDSRIAHEQMGRTFQFDLIKLELEDPNLMAAAGAPWSTDLPTDFDSLRQFLYIQMWVSYMAVSYVTGEASESVIRQVAALELFHGRAGRAYWAAVGKRQIVNSKGRRNRFFHLLDDEYNKVIARGAPVAPPIKIEASPVSKVRPNSGGRFCTLAVAAFAGLLIGRLWPRNGNLASLSMGRGDRKGECFLP